MNDQGVAKLILNVPRERIHLFFSLLRHGFVVEIPVGCSIKTLLRDALGLDDNYVENRIKTIFLDAEAVDDIDTACINNGSVLALSGAMPGLAGATLRRGGPLASLRRSITWRTDGKNALGQDGHVTVKLYNLLVIDLGPIFLEKGILIKKAQLLAFFRRQSEEFRLNLKSAYLNGQQINLDSWPEIELPDMLLLAVKPNSRA